MSGEHPSHSSLFVLMGTPSRSSSRSTPCAFWLTAQCTVLCMSAPTWWKVLTQPTRLRATACCTPRIPCDVRSHASLSLSRASSAMHARREMVSPGMPSSGPAAQCSGR